MAQEILTFADIVDAVSEAIGIQTADTAARNKIKRMVNMIYIDEVIPFKRWTWLEKTTQVVHKAYFNSGTVSVTPDSTTITFSTAPNVSLGSFANYRFSIDDSNQLYTISAHTAGSTTATLSIPFQEDLNATANFKVWRDRVDLPNEAKETTAITHDQSVRPLEAVGSQGFRRLEAAFPKAEGYPVQYNTWDFYDPSADTSETDDDRYRQIRVYPSITQNPVTLTIDYIRKVSELSDDLDEPVIPRSDRIVLVYGASAMAWSILSRNEEMHDKYWAKFESKLGRMAGERDDGFDTPALTPTGRYLNTIRKSGLRRRVLQPATGGQSSVALPSYLKNVIIDGGEIRNNLTVDTGITIDGRDISVDGATLDSLAVISSVSLADNSSGVVATFPLTTDDVVFMNYSISRGSALEAGTISLAGAGSNAAFAQGPVCSIGSAGVTLSADISGGNLRLLFTTTSTGSAATFQYRKFDWLG